MKFTEYTVERVEDPFNILTGNRYEFLIDFTVDEEDELFREEGLKLKALYVVDENGPRISHYHILEADTEKVLEFDLEDEEVEMLQSFCKEHYLEAEEE
ncbi:DUF6509 family protein [Robertmurraya korlensis]|uniref:DUF6509 family protein n=1 Tax=Robertmurraya korlensis TaxID=519977 RepID=UPI00203F7B1B|nr:DUF6509 family protein [Robertmurraya korlensis]MCM3599963.1 DUF6509 family protein [Robertmurraya korlensis]